MPVFLTAEDMANVRKNEIEVTGARFCSSCQHTKSVEGGKFLVSRSGVKRWKCAGCLAKSLPPTRSK